MKQCAFFDKYVAEQKQVLQQAIDEDKWYLSERAGYDVGFEEAMHDFMEHHLDRIACHFRIEFCQRRCPMRQSCQLATGVEKMRTSSELHAKFCNHC